MLSILADLYLGIVKSACLRWCPLFGMSNKSLRYSGLILCFTLVFMMAMLCNLRLLRVCIFACLNSSVLELLCFHKGLPSVLSLELFRVFVCSMLYRNTIPRRNKLGVVIWPFCTKLFLFQ